MAFIPGAKDEYLVKYKTWKTTRTGHGFLLCPIKLSDEPLLKDFFYVVSNDCKYRRYIATRLDMHHDRLQPFIVIDYTKEMMILAVIQEIKKELVMGMGRYTISETTNTVDVGFVVCDDYQGTGRRRKVVFSVSRPSC